MAILLLTFLSVWLSDQPERLKILVPVPAQSVEVKASSEYHEGDARRAIDGDGLEHHYHQSQNLGRGMWLTKISESEIQAHPNAHKGVVWLMTEFGDVRKIESLSVWNYNQDNHTDRGLRKVYLQYSADGTNWKTLMNGGEDFFTIPEAQGRKKEPASLEIPLKGLAFKYFLITADLREGNHYHDQSSQTLADAQSNNQNINYYGLSEVRFFEAKHVKPKDLNKVTDISFNVFPAYRKTAQGPSREYLVTFNTPLYAGGSISVEAAGKKVAQKIPVSERGIVEVPGLLPAGYMEDQVASTVRFESAQGEVGKEAIIDPARKWLLYFLPHSHLDIGYTHSHQDVLGLQIRNVRMAIDLIEKTKDYPEGSRFKWNVETLWPITEWMRKNKGDAYFNRFIEHARKGNIGLNAGIGNILTGLCTQEELMHLCDDARVVEEHTGKPITSVMMSDVAGLSWGTVTGLAQNGVRHVSMAPNYVPHLLTGGSRVGYVHREWGDYPFYWESQSGKDKILFWSTGRGYSFFHDWLAGKLSSSGLQPVWNYLDDLEDKRFPYDISYLRYTVNGDNGPPDGQMSDLIREWNETYAYPRFVIGTTTEVFTALEEKYGPHIPSFKDDFTPYWEDGAASTAAELAMNRQNSERLSQLEILRSIVDPARFPSQSFYEAWRNVVLFSEHTWGASASYSDYQSDFTKQLWGEKRAFAVKADSITRKIGDLDLNSSGKPNAFVHVFNTQAWPRTDVVKLATSLDLTPMQLVDEKGKTAELQEMTSGQWVFIARDVPPLSSKVYRLTKKVRQPRQDATVFSFEETRFSNGALSVTVDAERGTISSLKTNEGSFDYAGDSGLNEYIYSGRNHTEPDDIESVKSVKIIQRGPVAATLQVEANAPGCNSLIQEYTLFKGLNRLEVKNKIDKTEVYKGENVRFRFPFNIPNSETVIDLPFSRIRPEREQLDGANKNFFTMNKGVSVEGQKHAILLASVDVPILEIGDPTGEDWMKDRKEFLGWRMTSQSSPVIYSWVMNNSWRTNYKATQSGEVTFNYSLVPLDAYSDLAKKTAFEIAQPLMGYVSGISVPFEAGFELTGSHMVAVSTMRPSEDGRATFVRLINLSEKPVTFGIKSRKGSGIHVSECDNLEKNVRLVTEETLWMKPYETINLLLKQR